MRTLRTLLVAAGLVIAAAAPAAAAPPSTDHFTNARAAAAWISSQVNAQGFVPSAFPPYEWTSPPPASGHATTTASVAVPDAATPASSRA